jgi:riboflavin kinase/FMN adenylyltransferase
VKVYDDLNGILPIKNPVVTIGSFDGVHVAHRIILNRLIRLAKEMDGESVILTFDPHPREVINPDFKLELINSKEEKIELLEKMGIDHVIFIPFTLEFSKISSRDFIHDVLYKKLNVSKVVVGYNHYFGHNREGGFDVLYKLGKEYGFSVEEIPEQDIQNESVSSSKIRKALESGNLMKAHAYLNYDYSLKGLLTERESIFSLYGYRSWLLRLESDKKLIPGEGLYYAETIIDGKVWQSAVFIKKELSEPAVFVMFIGHQGDLDLKNAQIRFKYMVRKCPEDADCSDLKKIIEAIIFKAGYLE